MELVQGMSKEVKPLIKAAKAGSGGNAEEIRIQVIKLRLECSGKMEALMSDAQKRQWQEMLGKTFETLRHH